MVAAKDIEQSHFHTIGMTLNADCEERRIHLSISGKKHGQFKRCHEMWSPLSGTRVVASVVISISSVCSVSPLARELTPAAIMSVLFYLVSLSYRQPEISINSCMKLTLIT